MLERRAHAAQIAAVRRAVDNAADEALEVEHLPQLIGECAAAHQLVFQLAHGALSLCNLIRTAQRLAHPLPQHPRAHRRVCLVHHPQQRAFFLLRAHGLEQLEIAPRVHIQLEILSLMIQLDGIHVGQIGFLRIRQIAQQHARRTDYLRMILPRIAVERVKARLHALEAVRRAAVLLRDLLDAAGNVVAQKMHELLFLRRRRADQCFARQKTPQLVHRIGSSRRAGQVCREHLAGRDVRKAQSRSRFAQKDRRNVVVAVLLQHRRFDHRARRDGADNFAFDKTLCLFRVLDLFTDVHLVPVFDQLGNIALAGMKRNAAHRCALLLSAVAAGQHEVKLFGRNFCVLKEHFVKIAQSIQQDAIAGFLDVKILPHHRRQFSHGIPFR